MPPASLAETCRERWFLRLSLVFMALQPMLAGLAVPVLLMMSAISMNLRYRAEFYPLLMLSALLGFRLLCREEAPRVFSRPTIAALGVGAVVAISLYGLPLRELIRQLSGWI